MNQLEELRDLLGTESGNAWITFMDHISETLSPVLKQGKPRKEVIDGSIIGEHGFSSWKEMIEAPVTDNGLGWNVSAWESWKRAYKIVQDYPYLRDIELGSSRINTIHRETKPHFPDSPIALNEYLAKREAAQVERQQNSLADAQNRVKQLESELAKANTQLELLEQKFDLQGEDLRSTKTSLADSSVQIGSLKQQNRDLADERDAANADVSRLEKQLDKLKNRSLFDRIFNR